jgi:polyvinyl alcohol dehydrogenase (cytochrome)
MTLDVGSVSVASGVLYASSFAGQMYALVAANGNILWNFASGGSVIDRPSIVDGGVYWGSGYRSVPPGIGNNKVYAFTLAGSED